MGKKFLTKKRQTWVNSRNGVQTMKGTPLRYNAGVQARYVRDMEKLADMVIAETEKEVAQIFKTPASKEFFAQDASISSIARINMNKLFNRLMKIVNSKAKTMADRMVMKSDGASKSNLNRSLKELSGGLTIKTNINSKGVQEAFNSSVNVNVDLIKTINANYLEQVKGAVNRSIQNGGGLETLIPDIEKFLNKQARTHKNKAKNVALDQTRKAYNSLNAERMKSIGMDEYEWIASGGGQEPRPHHHTSFPDGLNGGIYKLSEPPIIDPKTGERGIPGTLINCKCTMRPIIKFDEGEQVDSDS